MTFPTASHDEVRVTTNLAAGERAARSTTSFSGKATAHRARVETEALCPQKSHTSKDPPSITSEKIMQPRPSPSQHTHGEPIRTASKQLPAEGFVRQAGLIPDIVPFSPATLWRKVKSRDFPAPVKLSTRITAWRVQDVREWLERQH
jgi:prophage regulatory protein